MAWRNKCLSLYSIVVMDHHCLAEGSHKGLLLAMRRSKRRFYINLIHMSVILDARSPRNKDDERAERETRPRHSSVSRRHVEDLTSHMMRLAPSRIPA